MSQLRKFQRTHQLVADGILGKITLTKMKEVFHLPSINGTAHFAGQLAHETNNFKARVESLNYSVKGLINTFSFYRKNPDLAEKHGRKSGQKANQQAIANTVYADVNRSPRNRLGNVHPGDGWCFRGRGAIQITGRNNYEALFKWLDLPKDTDPDVVARTYYWEAALWFFDARKVWPLTTDVSDDSIRRVTKKINGGTNGLEHRQNLTRLFHILLTA